MSKYHQQAFNAIAKNNSDYEKFESMKLIIDSTANDAQGNEAANTYNLLRILSDKINSAGWEGRHSEIIQLIEDNMELISSMYEDFLP